MNSLWLVFWRVVRQFEYRVMDVRLRIADAELTGRYRGVSLERMIGELVPYLRGWAGYFGFSQPHELPSLDGWIRRRLRCVAWIQWKTRGQRYRELRRLNVPERSASAGFAGPSQRRRPTGSAIAIDSGWKER